VSGPTTYDEAAGGNIADQMTRYRQLAEHDALAGAVAIGKARGSYVPNQHVNEEKFPPLTVAEHLEMIALGENLARYYRHPSQVDTAVRAGASWDQIAAAAGTTEAEARAAYREWADGQHQLFADTGRFGLDDARYDAAVKAAGAVGAERRLLSAELNARRTAAAAVLGDYKAALASAPLSSPPGREWMLRLASVLEDLLAALGGRDRRRPS
jgi:hypothetical protein